MKVFRIFFKVSNALSTAKSCGSAEVAFPTIDQACQWAESVGKEKGWRVAMVAELPTLRTPANLGEIITHSWSAENESASSEKN